MKKLQLLDRIQKLAAIVHCKDVADYNLTEESLNEMRRILDEMTELYIAKYCETSY